MASHLGGIRSGVVALRPDKWFPPCSTRPWADLGTAGSARFEHRRPSGTHETRASPRWSAQGARRSAVPSARGRSAMDRKLVAGPVAPWPSGWVAVGRRRDETYASRSLVGPCWSCLGGDPSHVCLRGLRRPARHGSVHGWKALWVVFFCAGTGLRLDRPSRLRPCERAPGIRGQTVKAPSAPMVFTVHQQELEQLLPPLPR